MHIDGTGPVPRSVVGVETAVPAFVGYTERAEVAGVSATCVPMRIASMMEFEAHFGRGIIDVARSNRPPRPIFTIAGNISPRIPLYSLHTSLRLFYANGGADCYIISVGSYEDSITRDALIKGLNAVKDFKGPTLLAAPDASLLPAAEYGDVARAMLEQARDAKDRVALLDVAYARSLRSASAALADALRAFREALSTDQSSYGIAYFPYLAASIVKPADLDDTIVPPDELAAYLAAEELNGNPSARARLYESAARQMNLLPASVAMAGVITASDNIRGVWKAPANIAIAAVERPALGVDDEMQAEFNNPIDGMAINVIREFAGQGTLVWGARTLDGNSNDYRYVHVRRTVIYIEQSISAALNAFVFEPNDERTWTAVVGLVSQFLQNLWSMGGLTGATVREAFSVHCGLGSTMSAQDVHEGYMVVQVALAMLRPAEFIEITFRQKMEQAG